MPDQPAGRARPAGRRRHRPGPVDVEELFDLVRRAAPYASLPAQRLRRDARPAERPLPERRVRRAAAAHRLGPGHRDPHGPPGRPAARGHQRRHHPRPRPLRCLPGRRGHRRRVGELDEEMVYESRVGDVFALGATSWRIEDITHDRVLVTPAPGVPGRLPFWKGDALGRPAELGAAIGAFIRELAAIADAPSAVAAARGRAGRVRRRATSCAPRRAARGHQRAAQRPAPCWSSGSATSSATGGWSSTPPTARRCTRPWALAISARLARALRHRRPGDGLRRRHRAPDPRHRRRAARRRPGGLRPRRDRADIVTAEVGGSALFAVPVPRVRGPGAAAPPARPGSPLPAVAAAATLGAAARGRLEVPVASRSCWRRCASACRTSTTCPRWSACCARSSAARSASSTWRPTRPRPSRAPCSSGTSPQFVYEGDSPLAERRAAALCLDQGLLAELLGRAELRELLDPEVLAEVEAELQRLMPEPRARDAEGVADLLRLLGPLSTEEVARARSTAPTSTEWLASAPRRRRRVVRGPDRGPERWAAVEDVARLRDGLGVPSRPARPRRSPSRSRTRWATWSPASRAPTARSPRRDVAARLGLGVAVARHALQRLGRPGPGARRRVPARRHRARSGATPRCCATLRRRSLARLRKEVEPVDPAHARAGSCPRGSTSPAARRAARRRRRAVRVDQLAGCAGAGVAPWSRSCCPPACATTSPRCSTSSPPPARCSGPGTARCPAATAGSRCTWPTRRRSPCRTRRPDAGRAAPRACWKPWSRVAPGSSASSRTGSARRRPALSTALWGLVWAGRVTNDTLARCGPCVRSGDGEPPHRAGRRRAPDACRPAAARPTTAGRWSLLPERDTDPTRRAHAAAERAARPARRGHPRRRGQPSASPGGFAAVYKVLSAFEDSGRCRRGYFVEGLGAAQFGTAGAVDRLRTFSERPTTGDAKPVVALALAATDPANPYGAALPWPDASDGRATGPAARPAPWSCWSTAHWRSTSSAAAAPC